MVGDPFKQIFNIPLVPTPREIVEPKPPLIRPEIKPPIVYDVPIPRRIHEQEIEVGISPTTGEMVTTTIPGYEEIVTRREGNGDPYVEVKDVVSGAIDKFYIGGKKETVLDPLSRREYIYLPGGEKETIFRTEVEHVIQKEFWGLPGMGLQGQSLLAKTVGDVDIFGGLKDLGKYALIGIAGIIGVVILSKVWK